LERGIKEGDNPVLNTLAQRGHVLVFSRVGLFENAAQSWVVNSI